MQFALAGAAANQFEKAIKSVEEKLAQTAP